MTSQPGAQRRRDLEIVVLEQGDWTSYSSCGILYLVAGELGDGAVVADLVVRTPPGVPRQAPRRRAGPAR